MNVNRISDRVESAACQSKEYVEDHAMPAALVAFGPRRRSGLRRVKPDV